MENIYTRKFLKIYYKIIYIIEMIPYMSERKNIFSSHKN